MSNSSGSARPCSKMRGPAAPVEEMDPALLVKIPKGNSHKPGADHADIALLRQRLKLPADAGAKDTLYDPKLVEAVKEFQKDKRPRDATAWSIRRRAPRSTAKAKPRSPNPTRDMQRILINMERWRWMPEDMGDFYVWNNSPEFTTRIMKDGEQVVHRDKIIVGQPTWPTPIFSADMLYVIFNPEWGMPDGIKMKELKPRLQASGGGFFDSLFGGGGGSVIRAYGLRVSLQRPARRSRQRQLVERQSFAVQLRAAGRRQEPAGRRQVPLPQQARCLHARHARARTVRALFIARCRTAASASIIPTHFARLLLDHDRNGGQSTGDATLDGRRSPCTSRTSRRWWTRTARSRRSATSTATTAACLRRWADGLCPTKDRRRSQMRDVVGGVRRHG